MLFSFIYKAQLDDYVWHYDTNVGFAYLAKIKSSAKYRDFALSEENIDIWHYRDVELGPPMPLYQLHGDIVASLRFPKQSFWSMTYVHQETERIWSSRSSSGWPTADSIDIQEAYTNLVRLMRNRLRALDYKDWETLTKEYAEKQGGIINGPVGGTREGIDVEAIFRRGFLQPSTVRFQVRRYTDTKVDWPEINECVSKYGQGSDFVFVSAFGFTTEAIKQAEDKGVELLDDTDMIRFLLTSKTSTELDQKLGLRGILLGSK